MDVSVTAWWICLFSWKRSIAVCLSVLVDAWLSKWRQAADAHKTTFSRQWFVCVLFLNMVSKILLFACLILNVFSGGFWTLINLLVRFDKKTRTICHPGIVWRTTTHKKYISSIHVTHQTGFVLAWHKAWCLFFCTDCLVS